MADTDLAQLQQGCTNAAFQFSPLTPLQKKGMGLLAEPEQFHGRAFEQWKAPKALAGFLNSPDTSLRTRLRRRRNATTFEKP